MVLAWTIAIAAVEAAAPRRHTGMWVKRPQFTPGCECGSLSSDEIGIDPTRNFCCDASPGCPPKYVSPATPTNELPAYTSDGRRDHHHVLDGPIVGNGNIGVAVGSGNLWNVSYPWLDLFISTNSFWALTGANHSSGTPFRGRLSLPGTMQIGVARLNLPSSFVGSTFTAAQDYDAATVTVNLTTSTPDKVTVSLVLWVSPIAPVVWSQITAEGNASPLQLTLNTTVRDHFYHRDTNFRYNTSFPLATSAACGGGSADATVSRGSDFVESGVSITGAIHHTLRLPSGAAAPVCTTAGQTSATLAFHVAAGAANTVTATTVVRTSKDPPCVVRPVAGSEPLCGLPLDQAVAAAATIAKDLASASVEQARADHSAHWSSFWKVSRVSMPDAPETEDFWYGAQYVLNSAIPHEGQEQTPPGLYGPWGTTDNPGWHGDYTIDYNYEATFYGVMSSNHPEMMRSYPNPLLDFMPSARKYAAEKSQTSVGRTCPGLHYPDVLAPWGFQEGADGVNEDAGLNSNGPYSTMPIVWAWEYGDRTNKTEILAKWLPLIQGEADYFTCFLTLNKTDGYLHDLHDCTNESPGLCPSRDTVLTLSMMRRAFDVVSDMAAFVGQPLNPKWATTLANVVPDALGYFHGSAAAGYPQGNVSYNCSYCASVGGKRNGPLTVGDCQASLAGKGGGGGKPCAPSTNGKCPAGLGLCTQRGFAASVQASGRPGGISGGNSQSIFPCFPGDYVGTNSSRADVGASTVMIANSWSQGNSFSKIYSAAARVVKPGLLKASDVYRNWLNTLKQTQQPNGIPFNPFSGFETIGSTEYVNYMLLQSDPGGFLGLFEAWPHTMDASFQRLRGRGAFIVSSSFSKSSGVGTTTLVSNRGAPCTVRRPASWDKSSVAVTSSPTGSVVRLAWQGAQNSEFFSFQTQAGQIYTLTG